MIRIVHYRDNCIGCNLCVDTAPKHWEMDMNEMKSVLKGAKQDNDTFVREITPEEVAENEKAADGCPVKIIKVVKD